MFRALASPTPLDLRWVGISLMHEMHLPEAELRLRQAIAGGDVAAGIFLSAVQLLNRTIDHALVTLEAIDPAALPDAEAALWHRERVRVGWLLGDARDALLERAEQAWRLSSDAPERVQVSVVTLLGQLHGHFGEHGRALAYLDFAAEYAQPRQREYVALCRATSLIALGRFDEAREQLDSITSASVAPLREIKRGQWLRGQGRWAEAQSTLEALLTGEAGAFLDQLMVFPELLPLVTASGQDALARQYLSRADHLKGTATPTVAFWWTTGRGSGSAARAIPRACCDSSALLTVWSRRVTWSGSFRSGWPWRKPSLSGVPSICATPPIWPRRWGRPRC